MTPRNLPSIAAARLPEAYIQARQALERCTKVDECQRWADKAAALASYAKQSKDEALFNLATRIKARAIRQCGKLLEEVMPGKAGKANTAGGTRKGAARSAGLSKRQQDTALRVASISDPEFELAVESDRPPSVTTLAAHGTRHRAYPPGFKQATEAIGTLKRFAKFCDKTDPAMVANGVRDYEWENILTCITVIDEWMGTFAGGKRPCIRRVI